MSHTPGPWSRPEDIGLEVGTGVEVLICHEDGSEDGGRPVCGIYRSQTIKNKDRRKIDWRVYNEEDIANARLIAAAPDLLAAAKQVVAECEPSAGPSNGSVDKLEAAIAKAEGKTMP